MSNCRAAYRTRQVREGHRRGWSFTPLRGKRPYLLSWQARPRETESQAIQWARRNIGLRCGRASGVLALDVDQCEMPDELAEIVTPTVRTGSGKWHLYCRAPEQSGCPDLLLPNGRHVGEVKGDGGQVVFVGSTHPDTREMYDWVPGRSPADVPMSDAPSWVFERPPRAAGRSWRRGSRARSDRGSLHCAARAYMAKVPGTGEGSRHTAAVALAAHLTGFEATRSRQRLSPDQVRALVHEWNSRNTPPLLVQEIDDIVAWFARGGGCSRGPVHLVRDEIDMDKRTREAQQKRRDRVADRRRRMQQRAKT